MQKNIIIGTIAIVVLAIGGVYLMTRKTALAPTSTQPQYESKEFDGYILKVEGDTIFANGVFVVIDHPELSGSTYRKDVQIKLAPDAKVTRISTSLPNLKAGQSFDYNKLPTETKDSSLLELTAEVTGQNVQGLGITAKAGQNIYGQTQFTADEIQYRHDIQTP